MQITLMMKTGRALLAGTALLSLAACTVPRTDALTDAEMAELAQDRLDRMIGEDEEPVTGPIDIYEAMARAIKYNLDQLVEVREEILRNEELNVESYDLLPDLVANANYSGRNNLPGSQSTDVPNGATISPPSRSSDKTELNAELTLSWDVLDFGLGWVRAKQASDEIYIAEEQRRATINRVIEDVRTAYWRAVASQRLMGRIDRLERSAVAALNSSERQAAERTGNPLDALNYQRELLGVLRSVQELRRDLGVAKNQLAALMNLRQGQEYDVIVRPHADLSAPIVDADPDELVFMALQNRPELREITYRLRINEREKDVALLEVLPSISGFLGINYSDNKFLYNSNWLGYGARASWNLLNVFRLPARQDALEAGDELLDARALALTQAVATQVFVAKARVLSLSEEANLARRYHNLSDRISTQTRVQVREGQLGQLQGVREELNAVLGSLRYDVTYADLQSAFANLYSSVGLDPYAPGLNGDESIDEMAQALRELWFDRGDSMAFNVASN
ncbi:MAG: TolC family protein [Pseudomonadota bacterium]